MNNWSVISHTEQPGEVVHPTAAAVDAAGDLYVAESGTGVQKRDAQGKWSVIATQGAAALAVDPAGNLYVAGSWYNGNSWIFQIQKRDAQGNWSVIATWV